MNGANNTDPNAHALVAKLDGLPLALSTAGSYLEHVNISFGDYLRYYEESWLRLQISSPRLNSYEDRPLYTTWQVTFDRIRKQNPAAAELLNLWAYFDKQDVWFGLLQKARYMDNEWIQKLAEDELSFNEAIRLLCEYGLVHSEPSLRQPFQSVGYSVHSCVHSWTIFMLNSEWDNDLARIALTCVAWKVPPRDVDKWWLLQQRLLQHATRHKHFIIDRRVSIEGIEWVPNELGQLYVDQSKLADAEAMYTRALQGYEKAVHGPKHTATYKTLNNLGNLYSLQGKLADAEAMFTRALQGYEKAFGPKHISTLGTVNNLGALYQKQGKLVDAEAMFNRALQGKEEALGPKHISMLRTVHNLGILYGEQGKPADAEAMFTRALQGYEKAFGPKHISTLGTVNNLGALYQKQGKLVDAEAMYTRALQGFKEALGPNHISTLQTVFNLGLLYRDQGKLVDAEAMFNRTLQGVEEALGPELLPFFPLALDSMFYFGTLLSRTGRKDRAKIMYTRALAGYKVVHGPSSEQCKMAEDLLQELEIVAVEPKEDQNKSTNITSQKSKSLKRKLGTRLDAG